MSDPTDIKALDEYLKGDSEISRRYRELGRDDVPPELDHRVLTAARDAVVNEGTQRSRSWLRWSAPVALAASVVLVVAVVLERGPQDDLTAVPAQAPAAAPRPSSVREKSSEAEESKLAHDELRKQSAGAAQESAPVYIQPMSDQTTPTLRDMPTLPAPATVTAAKAEVRPIVPPPELPDIPPDVVEQQSDQAVAAVAPAPAEPAAAQPESVARNEEEADSTTATEAVAVSGMHSRRSAGRTAGPRGTISTSGALARESRPASDDQRADRSDPEAWLEEIRDLRRAGKSVDADREWDLFHRAFPDFHVADDDLARKLPPTH